MISQRRCGEAYAAGVRRRVSSGAYDFARRALRLAPIVACFFAGCTCSGTGTPAAPTPTAERRAATPTVQAATPTPASAAAADVTPSEAPTPEPVASPTIDLAARRGICEHYISVLSGSTQDAAALDSPEARGIAGASPALVACGAMLRDSPDACKLVSHWRPCPDCDQVGFGLEKKKGLINCHMLWQIFHYMRAEPKSLAFMVSDCYLPDHQAAPLCQAMLKALRAADASQCAHLGDSQQICREMISLDPATCKNVEVNDQPFKFELSAADCQKRITSRKFLAKGLKALAESGPPADPAVRSAIEEDLGDPGAMQKLAQAALGRADSCASFATPAMDFCMGYAGPMGGATPQQGQEPAPSAASPPAASSPAATPPQS